MYDGPREKLPDIIQLEKNFTLTRFDKKLVKKVAEYHTEFYSGYDLKDLENCRFCAVYDYEVSDVNALNDSRLEHFIQQVEAVRRSYTAIPMST